MNKEYKVRWEIDIAASTPKSAACIALDIQRDAESWATVFEVTEKESGETVVVDVGQLNDTEKENG